MRLISTARTSPVPLGDGSRCRVMASNIRIPGIRAVVVPAIAIYTRVAVFVSVTKGVCFCALAVYSSGHHYIAIISFMHQVDFSAVFVVVNGMVPASPCSRCFVRRRCPSGFMPALSI